MENHHVSWLNPPFRLGHFPAFFPGGDARGPVTSIFSQTSAPKGDLYESIVPWWTFKIAGKWMFIPLKMVLIGIDPYPYRKYMVPGTQNIYGQKYESMILTFLH